MLPSSLVLDAIDAAGSIAMGTGSTPGVPAGNTDSDITRSASLSVAIIAEKLRLEELSRRGAEHEDRLGTRSDDEGKTRKEV